MQRRQLLRALAAMPLAAGLRARAAAAPQRAARVRPGQAGWPSEARWQELNAAVGGRLSKVAPLFTCTENGASDACKQALANLRNPFYLSDQPGGTEVSGWTDAWTPAPSAYAVRAQSSADVQAAVNFAREQRVRLVVKGTGHSYLGTSNAPDSLLVWTRALNEVTLHEAFVPQSCAGKVAPVPAVSAGAGCMWIDLYDAVTTRGNRYVQGGGCTSVGVAGLVQSGGFGTFSKCFGTAAAGLIEAEIVTADGKVRTVNACRDPDLYFALRGGGGGSWGVITRVTLKTHDLPEFMGAAWGTIKANSEGAFKKLVTRFFDFYVQRLFNPHWGEQVAVQPNDTLKISMVSQGLDKSESREVWQPFFDWVQANAADYTVTDELGTGAKPARRWWQLEGSRSLIADPRPNQPPYRAYWQGDQDQVGMYLHGYESLWLPATLLAPALRAQLVDALIAGARRKEVELHFNKGLAGAPAQAIAGARETATNPVVTTAFALAIIADGEGPHYPGMGRPAPDVKAARADARAIDAATAELTRLVPRAGSYVSESNYFNKRWADAYWGAHYRRLRAIKERYDPEGLFFVHNGVGSEAWSADGFTPA
jgi:FAD/FMN-containing dehydrogenase